MKTRLAAPTFAVAAVAGLAFTGCGTLDTAQGEGQIKKEIEKATGLKNVKVDCPDDVEQKKGKDFECKVSGGPTGTVKVAQTDDDGHVTYDLSGVKVKGG